MSDDAATAEPETHAPKTVALLDEALPALHDDAQARNLKKEHLEP